MTDGKGVDKVVVAGGGCETFESAVKALKPVARSAMSTTWEAEPTSTSRVQNGALEWGTNRSAAA